MKYDDDDDDDDDDDADDDDDDDDVSCFNQMIAKRKKTPANNV